MSFKPYPKYKESGVEWLGRVPEHWEVLRLKYHLDRNDGGVWGDDPPGSEGTIVLRSTEQAVDGRWQIEEPAKRLLSPAEESAALLAEGDLLLTKSSGSSLHIGKTSLVDADVAAMKCCYSNFMQRLRMKSTLSPKLAWYFLNNDIARKQFDLLSNSTTGLANLNASIIGHVVLPSPPPEEQPYLTSFLDHETAKIDALIAEQQRLIELLQEKRQAVISHAVTKGLNPDAPMKDSGIEWLGEVPEHWKVTPLGHLCDYISYGFTNPMPTADDGPYLLTANDIAHGHVLYDSARRTTDEAFLGSLTDKSRPMKDDLLVTKDGTLGRVAIHDGRPACINQSVALLRLDRQMAIPQFVATALRGAIYQERMVFDAGGTTIKHIYISRLSKLPVAVPGKGEQSEIVSELGSRIEAMQELIGEAITAVNLLQERRSALISAAVTGQIDVRGFSTGGASEAA